MSIYVYNCILHQNSSISDSCKINRNVFETENQMCYPEDRSNSEIENLEKISLHYQKIVFDKACESSLDKFIETTTNQLYDFDPVKIVISDITNIKYLNDYPKMSCFDYEKYTFLKKIYDIRTKEEVASKSVVFQIVYYSLQFINIIMYLPVAMTSFISIGFIDLFF